MNMLGMFVTYSSQTIVCVRKIGCTFFSPGKNANLLGMNPVYAWFPEGMTLWNPCANCLHFVYQHCAHCAIMPSFNCETCYFWVILFGIFSKTIFWVKFSSVIIWIIAFKIMSKNFFKYASSKIPFTFSLALFLIKTSFATATATVIHQNFLSIQTWISTQIMNALCTKI